MNFKPLLNQRVRRFISRPLRWSSATKALMVLAVVALVYGYFLALASLVICCGENLVWVDQSHVLNQLLPLKVILGVVLVSVLGIPTLRYFHGDSVFYEYWSTLVFVAALAYLSFQIGTDSMTVGVALVTTPLAGITFLNRTVVSLVSVLMLVGLLLLSLGTGLEWWASSPVFLLTSGLGSTAGQALVGYVLALPFGLIMLATAYATLKRWRVKEEKIRLLNATDPLTGLFNRRSILSYLKHERLRSLNRGPALSLLMVDIDHLKQINDNLGHDAGDFALLAASEALQQCLRQNDRLGRYGGEEFLIILPGTDMAGAQIIAERCRYQIETASVPLPDAEPFKFTASIGAVCNEGRVQISVEEMVKQAAMALAEAKDAGRNQISSASLLSQ